MTRTPLELDYEFKFISLHRNEIPAKMTASLTFAAKTRFHMKDKNPAKIKKFWNKANQVQRKFLHSNGQISGLMYTDLSDSAIKRCGLTWLHFGRLIVSCPLIVFSIS